MGNSMFCGMMIKQMHDEMERRGNNALRSLGLTIGQVRLLIELSGAEGKQLTLKELERRFHVAQSTAAGMVSRLEQKGFVERLGDPGDRRIKLVRITPAGERCLLLADQERMRAEEQLVAPLSEQERALFFHLLQKVTKALE